MPIRSIYNQFLFKKIPFEPEKLTPIVNLFHLIQVLVVNSQLGAKTVDQLVAVSKEKPGTLNYLTASIPCVVYMDSLKRDKGADWVRVPFRGGGEAVTAILGGTTPIGLFGLGNVISQIKAGKMTPLALVNNIRTPQLPDVPTLADIGYKGAPSETWYGLFAPAGTPKAIVDKLNSEIVKVVSDPAFREKYIISRGLVPALNTPEEFAARHQDRPRRRQAGGEGSGPAAAVEPDNSGEQNSQCRGAAPKSSTTAISASGPTFTWPAKGWSMATIVSSPANIRTDSAPVIADWARRFSAPKKNVKPIVIAAPPKSTSQTIPGTMPLAVTRRARRASLTRST